MAEYIEREATIKLLRSLGSRDYRREKGTIQEAIKMVSFPEYTPSVDVAPVRHGYWVIDDYNTRECHCSECEWPAPRDVYEYHREQTGYCPVCGAKMEIDYYE